MNKVVKKLYDIVKQQEKHPRRDVCWLCGGTLSWCNDYDMQDVYPEEENTGLVAILQCSQCNAEVEYRFYDEVNK